MRYVTSLVAALFVVGPVLAQNHLDGPGSPTAGPAQKIWNMDVNVGDLWFRKTFSLGKPVKSASLVISCDDQFTLYVNGKRVAHEIDWERIVIVNIASLLRADSNTIAVHGVDTGGSSGLVVWVTWEDEEGDVGELVTDGSWRVSSVPVEGWQTRELDDTGWRLATEQGNRPYGKNVHGMEPRERVYRTLISDSVDDLEEGIKALRSAPDLDAASEALDRLERALMEARRDLWAQKKKREERKDRK